jgi:hypothetical protein
MSTNYKLVISGTVSLWPDTNEGMDALYCYDQRCSDKKDKKVKLGHLRYKWGYHPHSVIFYNKNKDYNWKHIYEDQINGQGRKLEAELVRPSIGSPSEHYTSGSITIEIWEQKLK